MYETNSENSSEAAPGTHAELADLLSRAQQGNCSALQELVERHRDDVYGFLVQMTRSPTVAVELAGQSFLSTHRRLKEFRSEAEYAASLHRAAAKCALEKSRVSPEGASTGQLERPDVEDRIRPLNDGLRSVIKRAVDQLPPSQRQIFLLKDVAGLSYEEIAEISDHSIRAIKSYLHQARLSLQEAIDRFYRGGEQAV